MLLEIVRIESLGLDQMRGNVVYVSWIVWIKSKFVFQIDLVFFMQGYYIIFCLNRDFESEKSIVNNGIKIDVNWDYFL